MKRTLVRITAMNKREAIAALETMLEIVKARDYSDEVLTELVAEDPDTACDE